MVDTDGVVCQNAEWFGFYPQSPTCLQRTFVFAFRTVITLFVVV
jgi:hypothetical protein